MTEKKSQKGVKKPTKIIPQHRLVFKHYKDGNFSSMKKAMVKSGYSLKTASHSQSVVKKSKSWQALMKEYLPDELLASRHSELLDKRVYRKAIDENGDVVEVDNGPDASAVSKALDLAYKLKGSYKDDAAVKPSTVMYNLFYNPEAQAKIKNFETGLKELLSNEIDKKNQGEIEKAKQRAIDAEFVEEGSEDTVSGGAEGEGSVPNGDGSK